jgi:hypothetical protein
MDVSAGYHSDARAWYEKDMRKRGLFIEEHGTAHANKRWWGEWLPQLLAQPPTT